jgi:hypothetical protein
MNNPAHFRCSACGAGLDAEINREYIFCKYCGAKNRIDTETMRANINLGNINITAKTDLDSLISYVKYLIGVKQFDKANEIFTAAIISYCEDYRTYICKIMVDLHTNDINSMSYSIEKLRVLESTQQGNEVTQAIKELMAYHGMNGITVLHIACFHGKYELVIFCVEHGSDVNAIANFGSISMSKLFTEVDIRFIEDAKKMDKVTPITIMLLPANLMFPNLNRALFIENKNTIKTIRRYLMQHGAKDRPRMSYDTFRSQAFQS